MIEILYSILDVLNWSASRGERARRITEAVNQLGETGVQSGLNVSGPGEVSKCGGLLGQNLEATTRGEAYLISATLKLSHSATYFHIS